MTVKLGNGRLRICKWQDKSCAKVKMDCILRHNTGGELILHFPPRIHTPGAGNEKCEVCLSPGWGWASPSFSRWEGVVWHGSIKLTESIKAAPSCLTSLPFPLRLQYKLFIMAPLCFCFMLQEGAWIRWYACRVCVRRSPLVPGWDSKQLNYIQKCMKNSKGCH